jgi:hypothetical protein
MIRVLFRRFVVVKISSFLGQFIGISNPSFANKGIAGKPTAHCFNRDRSEDKQTNKKNRQQNSKLRLK